MTKTLFCSEILNVFFIVDRRLKAWLLLTFGIHKVERMLSVFNFGFKLVSKRYSVLYKLLSLTSVVTRTQRSAYRRLE